jgi:hypothetical protein
MRKFLISSAVILLAFQASKAQTEKGIQNIGLNIGASNTSTNNYTINISDNSTSTLSTKTTLFNIGPNYSYFIANKLDVGINFSYSLSNSTNSTENFTTTNDGNPTKELDYNYGGNIFIRKYYMYKDKIGFRTGAYLGYTTGNSTSTYSPSYTAFNYKSTNNYYFGGLNVDMVYYPSKKLGIAATLANLEYEHYNIDRTTQGHEDGSIVNFSFINNNLSLSIFYIIGK